MIVIRVERCLGCKSCELACAVAHSSSRDLETLVQSGEHPGYRVVVESCRGRAVPIHCSHCEDPACQRACPTGAIHRDGPGGPVLVDRDRCIGCRWCIQACPFGVIALGPDGRGVLKCDLCVERLASGEEPACVSACPTGALIFVEEEEANRQKRRAAGERLVAGEEKSS